MPITHLLLDIEGTTCPVSFVAEVLFPYARRHLEPYLQQHGQQPEIAALVADTAALWAADSDPGAASLLTQARCSGLLEQAPAQAVLPYLHWLIDHDIKATPLKDLQGRIWREGYASGALEAPLYADVAPALQRWHEQQQVLAVYSSGSVAAQQLLYQHSQAGDLRALFSHWFDTRTGPKQQAASYARIAQRMEVPAEQVLFISDATAELKAAAQAGMAVRFSDREGNPDRDGGAFERISDYSLLNPADGPQRP